MKTYETIAQFEQPAKGTVKAPRRIAAKNLEHGLADLAKLCSIQELRHMTVYETSSYNDNFGRKCTKQEPIIRLIRTGPQQFADENATKPWWETLK